MHRLEAVQKLPISLEKAWDYFSSPKNLREITPDEMGFKVLTPNLPEKMYPGIFIAYIVKPLMGIPMKWVTEITHIREKEFFVDEQRLGPYQIWHHQHFFKEIPGGVEMHDIVDYRLPLGILGKWVNAFFVGNRVKQIFAYRRSKLTELFGVYES